MNDPQDQNSPSEDELDRTQARPRRADDSRPEAEGEQTIRRRPARADASDSDESATPDQTIARPGARRRAAPESEGERTMHRGPSKSRPAEPRTPSGTDKTQARRRKPARSSESEIEATIQRGAPGRKDPLLGKTLGGCRLDAKLGEGGMGTVYRARQLDLDRDVAVKTIRPEHAADEESLRRFQREAKAVGKFRTQHVVQVYQVGNEQGIPFIVLELVPGGSLADFAEKQEDQRIHPEDAVRFLREAALALSDAAEKGVVHRDIKPDNLLLDENEVCKIADFGISKMVSAEVSMNLTMGGIVGTPLYMSPEQCRGDEIDFRSDMWSLGATFFYLLTGKPPAKGSSILELIQTKNKVRNLDPAKILPDEIPGPLSQVIKRLTMLEPAARYASYDELLQDLEAIDAGRRVGGGSFLATFARWSLALVVLGGGGYAGYHYRAEIVDLWESMTKAEEPEEPAGPDAPEPTIDLRLERERFDGIEADRESAGSNLEALQPLVDRLSEQDDDLKTAALEPANASLRDDIQELQTAVGELQAELGTSIASILVARKRDQFAKRLDEIEARITRKEDLAKQIDDVDVLLGSAEFDDTWQDLNERANGLKLRAQVSLYTIRIETEENRFESGPQLIRSEIEGLVQELGRETNEAFAEAKTRAENLETDCQSAIRLARDIEEGPRLKFPFEEVARWAEDVQARAATVSRQAKTTFVAPWASEAASKRLDDADLRQTVTTELAAKWGECKAARDLRDVAKVADLNRDITAALEHLSVLPGFDPEAVVPTAEREAMVEWIADNEGANELITRIREALKTQQDTGTLNAWLTRQAGAQSLLEQLVTRSRQDPALEEVAAELTAAIGFWERLTETAESALKDLGDGRLGAAQNALRFEGLETPPRAPLTISEIDSLNSAVTAMDEAYALALVDLNVGEAIKRMQAARTDLSRLPQQIQHREAALDRLESVERRMAELRTKASDMAPVVGGTIQVQTNQDLFNGTRTVGSFFIDRTETSRRAFLAALEGNRLSNTPAGELADLRSRQSEWSGFPDRPADRISRAAAVDFLRSESKQLPTFDEWWLAVKGAGETTPFPWGTSYAGRKVYDGSSSSTEVTRGQSQVTRDGKEMFHVVGNVAEWLADDLPGSRGFGILAGGGFGDNQRLLADAARGIVRRASLTRAPGPNTGCRGILDPSEFLGPLAPRDLTYPRQR